MVTNTKKQKPKTGNKLRGTNFLRKTIFFYYGEFQIFKTAQNSIKNAHGINTRP